MDITSFQGPYRWLSNFWPVVVQLDGVEYPTVEHAYQAAKVTDPTERERFRSRATPGEAKRLGRSVVVRSDWESVKVSVMRDLLQQKFAQSPLREKLIATGSVQLIEGNEWGDRFWGVCRGKGENNLGRLIMEIRDALVKQTPEAPNENL